MLFRINMHSCRVAVMVGRRLSACSKDQDSRERQDPCLKSIDFDFYIIDLLLQPMLFIC